MKKNILILGLVTTGLIFTAFKFMKLEKTSCQETLVKAMESDTKFANDFLNLYRIPTPDDLVYKVESRYLATVSKTDLDNAKSIIDILPKKATKSISSYHYARVSILDDFRETDQHEIADNETLTTAQLNLLRSTNDSENIYIRADYKNNVGDSGMLASNYLTYFISVVPDQQAVYQDGQKALVQYLRKNSKEQVEIISHDQLKPGKVRFTIMKDGSVDHVELTSTSGYDSVDLRLIELIENMPGNWTAASNSEGEHVDQEFVFFFGLQGC